MPRFTKKFGILIFGVIFTVFYCEFLIYYIVIGQCKWPVLSKPYKDGEILKALILSDIHLMGPRSNFVDKWRRESQMSQAFQAIITLHQPEVVFVLGDQFDEGQGSSDHQFKSYVDRFYRLFSVPSDTLMYVLAGNHDIGFHNAIKIDAVQRFTKLMDSPIVQLITLKDNHFVLINSMAMEGDSCFLCEKARSLIEDIVDTFSCMEKSPPRKLIPCSESATKYNYSRPILLQHFPLYRQSDGICNEPDSAPLYERFEPFRNKIDALSREATELLVSELRPRMAFGGHTHYGCEVQHKFQTKNEVPDTEFIEYSVPSFSWRNINEPKFMLVSVVPDEYAVNKCGVPRETTMAMTAVIFIIILGAYAYKSKGMR